MGKKKKGSVCNNPVAMARASGPAPVTGPTIRDYLARDRPSLEEATAIIHGAHSRKESGALAAYEEQMNDHYREELRKQRERLLGGGAASSSKDKKKKKKSKVKSHGRERSRSRSPSSHHTSSDSRHHKRKSRRRRRRRHHYSSTSSEDSDTDSERGERSKVTSRTECGETTTRIDTSRDDT